MPDFGYRAAIDAVTERVLRTEFPTSIRAAADGSSCAVSMRSPGRDATHFHRSTGERVLSVPGAVPLVWHAGGFVGRSAGRLVRWALRNGADEDLGAWEGRRVAAAAGADLWLADANTIWRHNATGAETLSIPLGAPLLGDVTPSPGGTVVAVRVIEERGASSSLRLFSRAGEELYTWREPRWCVLEPAFVDEERIVVTRMLRDSTAREIVLLNLRTRETTTLALEASHKGFVPLPAAVASRTTAAYIRYVDGWPLLCVFDLGHGKERVVNPGRHEDLTDVHDPPAFSPNGRYLAFNSSAADLRQRHLYVYDVAHERLERRSFAVGATGPKAWLGSGRLAFVESDEHDGASIRWLDLRQGAPSAPATPRPPTRPDYELQHLTLRGTDHDVPADLFRATEPAAVGRRPALVYAHGGVFRQLTRGYPASYGYTLLHEINLGLVRLGFVVMSVEYRGSMGFGLAHDQANYLACGTADSDDCALAAAYLASQPYVDPTRIGVWGLSWGGTMTLQSLVRYPERFAAGVNVAGIWDFEQRARFWNAREAGRPIYFDGRMGSAASDERRRASARELADQLEAPLLSLQGTEDESVDYQQQVLLANDAHRLGKDVRTLTLPGERHVFGGAEAWRVAVPAILGFLLKQLGPAPIAPSR